MKKNLLINGTLYLYQQKYLKKDELWECAYVDIQGNIAEVFSGKLVSYDESLEKAKKELKMYISENELSHVIDNDVILWKSFDKETQRKIKVKARTIKWELMGEWDTDESRYERWRKRMHDYCGIWFPKSEFNKA